MTERDIGKVQSAIEEQITGVTFDLLKGNFLTAGEFSIFEQTLLFVMKENHVADSELTLREIFQFIKMAVETIKNKETQDSLRQVRNTEYHEKFFDVFKAGLLKRLSATISDKHINIVSRRN